MNLLDSSPSQRTITAQAAPLTYREAAQWIAANQELADARNLAKLILSLSTAGWSYAMALECMEQMSDASFARALQVLKHYFRVGDCQELQSASRELRSMFPSLVAGDTDLPVT